MLKCRTIFYQIEASDIGRIQKMRIGHDGTGMFSGWFLDKVRQSFSFFVNTEALILNQAKPAHCICNYLRSPHF